jgi:hypothetical protein
MDWEQKRASRTAVDDAGEAQLLVQRGGETGEEEEKCQRAAMVMPGRDKGGLLGGGFLNV